MSSATLSLFSANLTLESSSTQTYLEWVKISLQYILGKIDNPSELIHKYIAQNQNFILWHYKYGSKYDSDFWDYAGSLSFDDPDFEYFTPAFYLKLLFSITGFDFLLPFV